MDKRLQAFIEVFDRTPSPFDEATIIYRETAQELAERLSVLKKIPTTILDLGTGLPYIKNALENFTTTITTTSFSRVRLATHSDNGIYSDLIHLPFDNHSFEGVISHLYLHIELDLPRLLAEIKRVLKPEGVFAFAYYGPDSFQELGHPMPPFIDMHDVGDALIQAGFQTPIIDMEKIIVDYDNAEMAYADLEAVGDHLLIEPFSPLPEKNILTYEIVYGHAFLPHTQGFSANQRGEVSIPVSALKRNKE